MLSTVADAEHQLELEGMGDTELAVVVTVQDQEEGYVQVAVEDQEEHHVSVIVVEEG